MNGLIRASLRNPHAVTVMCLTLVMLGVVSAYLIPIDILPVFLPFDPTSTTPVGIVAVDSPDRSQPESILYDVGRYEVRNMLMSINGAVAPVVYGGKIRAVMAYLDRQKLQARRLSPLDVMH